MHVTRCGLFLLSLAGVLGACQPSPTAMQQAALSSQMPKFSLTIENNNSTSLDTLRRATAQAIQAFEANVRALQKPIAIEVTNKCLRTGYDFAAQVVRFCLAHNTVAGGTQSEDVIHHEVFHAMMCQSFPASCEATRLQNDVEIEALHEGLADFFAYSLHPDDFFGEYFLVETPYIRSYVSSLCYSMTAGAHAKGNAISAHLIQAHETIKTLGQRLAQNGFSLANVLGISLQGESCFMPSGPQITIAPKGLAISPLGRYRVASTGNNLFDIQANTAFVDKYIQTNPAPLTIDWQTETGEKPKIFHFKEVLKEKGHWQFAVSPLAPHGHEKIIAVVKSGADVIGFEVLYLGIQAQIR